MKLRMAMAIAARRIDESDGTASDKLLCTALDTLVRASLERNPESSYEPSSHEELKEGIGLKWWYENGYLKLIK